MHEHFYKGSFIQYVRKVFRKTNISYLLVRTRTFVCQEVRNVSFSKNFAYVLIASIIKHVLTVPSMKVHQFSSAPPSLWTTFAKLTRFYEESLAWSNKEKRWPNLSWKKKYIWLNISEKSDTDLTNPEIMSPYLHGYANHLSTMQSATVHETTWRFNVAMVSVKNMTKMNDILFFKTKIWQTFFVI